MHFVEGLFIVQDGNFHPPGTLVKITESNVFGNYYNTMEEGNNAKDERFNSIDFSPSRNYNESKLITCGIDTIWGFEERRIFGIAILSLPDNIYDSFSSCKYILDFSKFKQEDVDKWKDENSYLRFDRKDTHIYTFESSDISLNPTYGDDDGD